MTPTGKSSDNINNNTDSKNADQPSNDLASLTNQDVSDSEENSIDYVPQRLLSKDAGDDSDDASNDHATRLKSNISIASSAAQRSFDESLVGKLRRTLSGASGNAVRPYESKQSAALSEFSQPDDLQRTKTRQTIISVLSRRAQEQAQYIAASHEDIQATTTASGRQQHKLEPQDEEARIELSGLDDDDDVEEHKSKLQREHTHNTYFQDDVNAQQLPTVADGSEFASMDPELVTWDTEADPNYPRNWLKKKKMIALAIVATYTFVGQVTSSVCALAMTDIDEELNVQNSYFSSAIVSVFLLSQGLAALLVSPLSELYGRRVVLTCSIFILTMFNLGCALTHDPYSLFVFRFFTGVGAAAPFGVGPAILADMFDNMERNKYMSFYNTGPNLAPVLGPLVSGFIVQNLNWRWLFWVLVIIDGTTLAIGLMFYHETYSPVLLHWKCKKLQKETGNKNLKTIYDIANINETAASRIMLNIARPVNLLFGHPMVYGLGIFLAFLFGFFYLILISFPTAWGEKYGFQIQIQGLMYISFGVAFFTWTPIWTHYTSIIYSKLVAKNNGVSKPEFRVTLLYLCGIFCPIGLLIYGWCVQYQIFWFVPCIGVFIYTGFYTGAFVFVTNYIVDMNPRFSASANSALALFRSIFGFVFPIFAPKMYRDIGYGWGNTIFFFIGMILGIPFPFYVSKYGEKLRMKANLKFDRKQAQRDAKQLAELKKKADKKLKLEQEKSESGKVGTGSEVHHRWTTAYLRRGKEEEEQSS